MTIEKYELALHLLECEPDVLCKIFLVKNLNYQKKKTNNNETTVYSLLTVHM